MAKTYFNNAIIGNSSMLGCLNNRGELVRLSWPNIDYPQHFDRMLTGIFHAGQANSTQWFSEECFEHHQEYIEDTNIVRTVCKDRNNFITVVQKDFVAPFRDILIRIYEITNMEEYEIDLGFMAYSSCISTTSQLRGTLFDFEHNALIHYMHGYYISISADREAYQFQLGNNAYDSARHSDLKGYDSIGMMNDGAVSWRLGRFKSGETKYFTLQICASNTLKGVKELVKHARHADAKIEYETCAKFWKIFMNSSKQVNTGKLHLDNLYKRSILMFKLMADKASGGLLAAPEVDEEFTRCGRYAYCWGRDAAFITAALDWCGMTEVVDKFYDWAVRTQDEQGFWHQRYHMDGNLAPSWGLQIDETGTLIWGMLEHYKVTSSKEFLARMWDSIYKGVEFLLTFIDDETGLPKPSFDLWEERMGEHTYSSAAVCAGIRAGAEAGRILGKPPATIDNWENAWKKLRQAILCSLWKDDRQCFLRSVRTKLNPWGPEHDSRAAIIEVNPMGYRRDVTLEDATMDASLLGVAIPFNVLDACDPRIEKTVDAIERVLSCPGVGGIKRYENDNYIGGNPWIVTTLWVALYHVRKGNFDRARSYLEWASSGRTELNLLPEQVDKNTGRPAWVIPLTWSHAMFILVLGKLLEAGVL